MRGCRNQDSAAHPVPSPRSDSGSLHLQTGLDEAGRTRARRHTSQVPTRAPKWRGLGSLGTRLSGLLLPEDRKPQGPSPPEVHLGSHLPWPVPASELPLPRILCKFPSTGMCGSMIPGGSGEAEGPSARRPRGRKHTASPLSSKAGARCCWAPGLAAGRQFGIFLFHSWASNGIKAGLFIFTDGAAFSGTSNAPDVVRTEEN